MMLLAEESFCDDGAPAGWLRWTVQWLGVILAHAAVIGFALQVSPQARQALGEIIQASLIAPQPLPLAKPPEPPRPPHISPKMLPQPKPEPILAATPNTEATPAAVFVAELPTEPVPVALVAPAAPAPAPVEAPPPPLVLPVFNADYLENPPPQYPPMSRRLGEKGRVLLRVFVSADGRAERIEVNTSSGFERLDLAARNAVLGWRFVPALRGDERVAAWVLVPVSFVM